MDKTCNTILLNPSCASKNFMDFVKDKCNLDKEAVVDFCDEQGQLANIPDKEMMESLAGCVEDRATYIPVQVEKDATKKLTKVTPLVPCWEKLFPSLEYKLQLLVTGGEKEKPKKKSPNPSEKVKGKREGDKSRALSRLESREQASVVDMASKKSTSRMPSRTRHRKKDRD